jgi:hypothetical protein
MTIYICPNCNKDFKQKINFINHTINKKIPCKLIIDLINTENPTANTENPTANTENPTANIVNPTANIVNPTANIVNPIPNTGNPITNIENPITNKLICQYCNNLFSRKDYLQTHIKKYCKNKKHIEELDKIKSKINIDIHHEKYEELLEKFNTLMTVCNEYEKIIKGSY